MEPDLSHARTFQQTEKFQADPVLIQWLALLVTKDPWRDFLPSTCGRFKLPIKLQCF